jgi:peroxiredoxin Q/BCP
MLNINDPAPDFDLPIAGGGTISLRALSGRNVVLFFYPKDDTPGCTAEALSFTEHAETFARLNTTIIGVSRDSIREHAAFQAKYKLKPILASDENALVAQRYGVWVEKTLYGRKSMGIARTTFLIDPKGTIRKIWRKVKPPEHGADVLRFLQSI